MAAQRRKPRKTKADASPKGQAEAPTPDASPEPAPAPDEAKMARAEKKARRRGRAAVAGATLIRHRDLFIQALELLRRNQAVSPEEEARILATYEEGTRDVRAKLSGLVDKLQRASLGETVIDLTRHKGLIKEETRAALADMGQRLTARGRRVRDAEDADEVMSESHEMLAQEGREFLERGREILGKEGRKFFRQGRRAFRRERKTIVGEGRALIDEYRDDIQAFLDENQPTIESVERVSKDLADAGRQLAAGIRVAGRDAADELLRRGRKAVAGIDTEEIEQAGLDYAAATLPRIQAGITRVLSGIGFFFVLVGLIAAAAFVPELRPFLFLAAGAVAFLTGLLVLRWARGVRRSFAQVEARVQELAAMTSEERRRLVVARARRGFGDLPPEEAPPMGPVPVPVPTGMAKRLQGGESSGGRRRGRAGGRPAR